MGSIGISTAPITVHHVTRIEGHGNLVVDIRNGTVQQCDLEIIEAPRFFEAMLRGVPFDQAPRLVSRICGICAMTHVTTAIKALERALGIEISRQTALLRRLTLCAEMIDSHVLHAYMLVAPDLLGAESAIAMTAGYPEAVGRALRMKQLAGDICAAVGGRHTHPIATAVGGFTHFPSETALEALRQRLEGMAPDIEATVRLFAGLALPDFKRESAAVALHRNGAYAYYDGAISSSSGGRCPIEAYRDVVSEYQTTHSNAKHAAHHGRTYMVGALARFNLNYEQLHPQAREAAAWLGLHPPCANPYLITLAQVIEIIHFTHEAISLIGRLLDRGIQRESLVAPVRLSGEGVGACEAPRGTLYHHYVVRNGVIAEANCVIPTGQNLANMEADMRALAARLLDRSREEITRNMEMLVRAYDPCISCAVHLVEATPAEAHGGFE